MPIRQERRHNGGNSNCGALATSLSMSNTQMWDTLPTRPPSALQLHTRKAPDGIFEETVDHGTWGRLGVQRSTLSDGTECGQRIALSDDRTYHGIARPIRMTTGLGNRGSRVAYHVPAGQDSGGNWPNVDSSRPRTATASPQLRRAASKMRITSHTEWKDADTTVWHSVPDSRYPWRDPNKQLSSTTVWADPGNATKIRPERPQTAMTSSGHPMSPLSNVHTTGRGKMEDGMLPCHSIRSESAEGKKRTRPNTALGLATVTSGTRPAIEDLMPRERPPTVKKIEEQHLERIRNGIYEKGIAVRKVFRAFDTDQDNAVSHDEFRKGVKHMNLGLDKPTINGLLQHLDPEGTGEIDYEQFIETLKLKETDGDYNHFLLERTYFEGKKDLEPLRERQKEWTAGDVKEAFMLKRRVAKMLDQKFLKASEMFRSLDDDHNGALNATEFTKKLKQFNVDVNPEEVDRMIDVIQFSKPGCITYQDFIDHFKVPDKWGFCSAFSDYLPLGKSGENPAPMDSTTLQKTVWRRQGRPTPHVRPPWTTAQEILRQKKKYLNKLSEQGKVLRPPQEVPTIVLPGKVSKGYLDEFLLTAFKNKLQTMRASTRDMYRLLDPHKEGRVSRDNFHKVLGRMNMGIPTAAVDDLMHYFDTDNEGFISMTEFAKVMDPELDETQRPFPDSSKEDRAEMQRLLEGASHPDDPPWKELHPMAKDCIQTGMVSPELVAVLQRTIEDKSRHMRNVFRLWDKDHDGYVTLSEMRQGMADMNLGLTHSVIAKIAQVIDVDGNGKLDYNEFVNALKVADKTGAENISHPRGYGYQHRQQGAFERILRDNIKQNVARRESDLEDQATVSGKRKTSPPPERPVPAGIVVQHRGPIQDHGEDLDHRDDTPQDRDRPARGPSAHRQKTAEFSRTGTLESSLNEINVKYYQTLSRDELRSSWTKRTEKKRSEVVRKWDKHKAERARRVGNVG